MTDEPAAAGTDLIIDWLRASRFCDGVEDEVLDAVAREVNVRTFEAGQTLASAGEEVTSLMILAEGTLKASFRDVKSRDHILGFVNHREIKRGSFFVGQLFSQSMEHSGVGD